ncbi:MAG: AAA family ATPase [Actinomycetota bacterium]|nr:AAA family ATPase [Actinomycetota bacterium]
MAFVGRVRAVSRMLGAVGEASSGRAHLVLVAGEAGIGKTSLIGEVAARAGLRVGWGTCADAERTPAFWPWTAALRGLLTALSPADVDVLTRTDTAELSRLLPELSQAGAVGRQADSVDGPSDADAARLRLFDAVSRFLERLARYAPTMVVLDDLQWADESSLSLLRFVARAYRPVPLLIVGAYRHDELSLGAARLLDDLAAQGEPIRLSGLSQAEVFELILDTVGRDGAQRWAGDVHRRTDGHPFFARQLAEVLADPTQPPGMVPAVAGELVARRIERLSPGCRALVEAAAVAGNELQPDVLGEVCGVEAASFAQLLQEGVNAGVLVRDLDGVRTRLVHDLFREAIIDRLTYPQRLALHQRIADALEHRHARGVTVVPADLARHCAATVPLEGGERAIRWARSAAEVERTRLAFEEAAGHLSRARRALEDTGDADAGPWLVDLLVEEADARSRTGDSAAARGLLEDARDRAATLGDGQRLGRVALGVQRLGARFAMPRDAVVEILQKARVALDGTGTVLEAQLTASLARELHHSVPAHRPRARPLSERAIELARKLDDPETLAACLLACHDVLWTPGTARQRFEVAREIADVAERAGDAERHAEGLLLTANALLGQGSPAFRAVLTEYLQAAERFHQPRHDYLALTRRAALAMIDGQLDDAERLIGEASGLGERIGEPDTGNVRLSQLLGLVRARAEPERLRATAAEAIRWWVGVPSHAHAVAAGFYALAGEPGDLDAARRALDTVEALGTWREDKSYLWSVFVGAMATAAVRLDDQRLCAELLAELEPLTGECGVNGAFVCFMGSNAHWAGILAGALGRSEEARAWLEQALTTHQRLGAVTWAAETSAELAASAAPGPGRADAELCRDGDLWRIRHRTSSAHLRDLKGLADLAVLLARPGTDVHVLELAGAGSHEQDSGPLLDATARTAYRRRLDELDEELATAQDDHDIGRAEHLETQRDALIAELGRAAGLAGRDRPLGTSTTERARKAVTARLREAIGRIESALPELGAHLDRSVLTGTQCRYEPAEQLTWTLSSSAPYR